MKSAFHTFLAELRYERGFSRAYMAEKLGVSQSVYAGYENGSEEPDLSTLERISDVLECSIDALFGRESKKTYPSYVKDNSVLYNAVTEDKSAENPTGSAEKITKDKKDNTGQYKRKLAIGVQDFRFLRERKAYYVDKTQLIEEFLDSWYQVTLVTRPRRFGKTLNMSMLSEFLDCTKDSREIFRGTKINTGEYVQEMNRHPVIFISFLEVKARSAGGLITQLAYTLCREYERYIDAVKEKQPSEDMQRRFLENYDCLRSGTDSDRMRSCIRQAVCDLCMILEACFHEKVFLLLDEYDTPFISASSSGYYDEVRDVLAGMLSSSLKGNPSLDKAMLTGIQRVAKENIFSGLNNLIVCTVKDREYADCFGFTEGETKELLDFCEVEFNAEVKEMYDGYSIGDEELYNPWSVSCYAARRELESYWVNTSENSILKNALKQQGESFASSYRQLIENGSADVEVRLSAAYYEQPDDASLWGLLLNAGMVTVEEKIGEEKLRVRVPNLEVWKAFRELTAFYLQVQESSISRLLYNLTTGDMQSFSDDYKRLLLELPSYYDLKDENSYHMMMLGMCAFLRRDYVVRSNRESGEGRGDILLYSKRHECPDMVLEFKYTKDISEDLDELAAKALEQVREKHYDAEMKGRILYVGIAHCGKNAEIRWIKDN